MNIGNLIKNKILELDMTLEEVGDKVGVGKSTVRKWENGMIENMGRDKIALLSKALQINPLILLDLDTSIYESANIDFIRIPLYSSICCGDGGFNDDNILELVAIPSKGLGQSSNYFAQYAAGDSMKDAGISDGDLLVFEKVNSVDEGAIGCFCIGDSEAMCKKYKKNENIIVLQPMNHEFDSVVVDPLNEDFRCVGRLRKVIKDF